MVNARFPKGKLAAGNRGRAGGYGNWNRLPKVHPSGPCHPEEAATRPSRRATATGGGAHPSTLAALTPPDDGAADANPKPDDLDGRPQWCLPNKPAAPPSR